MSDGNREYKSDVFSMLMEDKADFLRENRSEVVKVTKMDYTFDRQIELEREAARNEERKEAARKFAARFNISVEEAMAVLTENE